MTWKILHNKQSQIQTSMYLYLTEDKARQNMTTLNFKDLEFVEEEKLFDPEEVYEGQENPTKL